MTRTNPTIYWDVTLLTLILDLNLFKFFAFFKFHMLGKKADLAREKIKTNMFDKKAVLAREKIKRNVLNKEGVVTREKIKRNMLDKKAIFYN